MRVGVLQNHLGEDLGGGHYTACVRSPTDGHWYQYDDNLVTQLRPDGTSLTLEHMLQTPDAYILFYERIPEGELPEVPVAEVAPGGGAGGGAGASAATGAGAGTAPRGAAAGRPTVGHLRGTGGVALR